jgi:hypothetical protein
MLVKINKQQQQFPGQAILSVGFRPGLRRISSDFVGIRQNMAGIRSGCMQFRSYPTIGIRLKGLRQLIAEIRPRLFGSDGIRLGIIDLGTENNLMSVEDIIFDYLSNVTSSTTTGLTLKEISKQLNQFSEIEIK